VCSEVLKVEYLAVKKKRRARAPDARFSRRDEIASTSVCLQFDPSERIWILGFFPVREPDRQRA
jgi:hypothetical protein